jgi:hypothetical protein
MGNWYKLYLNCLFFKKKKLGKKSSISYVLAKITEFVVGKKYTNYEASGTGGTLNISNLWVSLT